MPPRKSPAKKSPPRKTSRKPVKPTIKQAIKSPARFAGSSKVALKPYGKPSKSKPRSTVDKIGENVLKFSPLFVVNEAFKLATGVDTDKPMYKNGKYVPKSKRKANRGSAAFGVALGAVPATRVTKAIKNVSKANKAKNDLKYGKNHSKNAKNLRRKNVGVKMNEYG